MNPLSKTVIKRSCSQKVYFVIRITSSKQEPWDLRETLWLHDDDILLWKTRPEWSSWGSFCIQVSELYTVYLLTRSDILWVPCFIYYWCDDDDGEHWAVSYEPISISTQYHHHHPYLPPSPGCWVWPCQLLLLEILWFNYNQTWSTILIYRDISSPRQS